MKKNRIKVISRLYFICDATADTKKRVFKSQIAVIIQASWHNNISIFVKLVTFYSPSCLGQETAKGPFGLRVKLPPPSLSTTVYCNKLRTNERHDLQNVRTTPAYTQK